MVTGAASLLIVARDHRQNCSAGARREHWIARWLLRNCWEVRAAGRLRVVGVVSDGGAGLACAADRPLRRL